jgi:hypothetical protein
MGRELCQKSPFPLNFQIYPNISVFWTPKYEENLVVDVVSPIPHPNEAKEPGRLKELLNRHDCTTSSLEKINRRMRNYYFSDIFFSNFILLGWNNFAR